MYFLVFTMVLFKLSAIQEYIHLAQHQKEQTHKDKTDCPLCHEIFKIVKFQSFDTTQNLTYKAYVVNEEMPFIQDLYHFVYVSNTFLHQLCNRPPPVV